MARQPNPPCIIDGCEERGRGDHGWCRKHWRRWQRHGDPLVVTQPGRDYPRCHMTCLRKVANEDTGLCAVHQERFETYGDPYFDGATYPLCKHIGCDRQVTARGLCNPHYLRIKRGAERPNKPIPPPPDPRISAEPLLRHVAGRGGVAAGFPWVTGRARENFERRLGRARESGTVSITVADEICCDILRVHPHNLWGEEWWTGLPEPVEDEREMTDAA